MENHRKITLQNSFATGFGFTFGILTALVCWSIVAAVVAVVLWDEIVINGLLY